MQKQGEYMLETEDELRDIIAQLQDEIMALSRQLAEKEDMVQWLSHRAEKCTCNPTLD